MINSMIITCFDLTYAQQHVLDRIGSGLAKCFFVDEFKVENSAAVIKEAYIAEEETKYLILSALTYNVFAQNALLKLLEEPPRNIVFVLISRSKNAFLPTILSRMQIETLHVDKDEGSLEIDLAHLDLNMIFNFVKKYRHVSQDELKGLIEKLLYETIVVQNIKLYSQELDMFDKSLELAHLHSRGQNILSYLLLMIYQAKMRKA